MNPFARFYVLNLCFLVLQGNNLKMKNESKTNIGLRLTFP